MLIENINDLLEPGYLPIETGYNWGPDGQINVAVLSQMSGCKAEWVERWISHNLQDTPSYKKWNSQDHIYYEGDRNWKPGRYIGTTHYTEVRVNDETKKSLVRYLDPAAIFDLIKLQKVGFSKIICVEGSHLDGTSDGFAIHLMRDTAEGCEMRTRYIICNGTSKAAQLRIEQTLYSMSKLSELLRNIYSVPQLPANNSIVTCKFCQSDRIVKNGMRKNVQYWLCKDCGRGFINNYALPKMRYSISTLASAIDNYYSGNSLNKICQDIEQKTSYLPSSSAVYTWIKKFTEAALIDTVNYNPVVGDIWFIHEQNISINGNSGYLTNVIDKNTGFVLATSLSYQEGTQGIQELMNSASHKAGKLPREIWTNACKNSQEEIAWAFRPGKVHIIKMEITEKDLPEKYFQTWGTVIKNRLKPSAKPVTNPGTRVLLNGFAFHYNYVNSQGNYNKLPAEAAKIQLPFRDWQDFISTHIYNI